MKCLTPAFVNIHNEIFTLWFYATVIFISDSFTIPNCFGCRLQIPMISSVWKLVTYRIFWKLSRWFISLYSYLHTIALFVRKQFHDFRSAYLEHWTSDGVKTLLNFNRTFTEMWKRSAHNWYDMWCESVDCTRQ